MADARVHHVANGSSTTRLIEAAGLPGTSSLWADPLHEGPVPGGLDDDALVAVRGRYLAGEHDPAAVAPEHDLRRWRDALAAAAPAAELVLWYEHDLFDQLNLVQLLSWLQGRPGARARVSAIDVMPFTARSGFKGIGQLAPEDVATLFASRRPFGEAAIALAAAAWTAFRAPSPQALDQLRQSDTSALPFLGAALHRFLQEYPWTVDGLSRSERRLLALAARGPATLEELFRRMHDGETAYYVTDLSLAATARSLAGTHPPLLALDLPPRADDASLDQGVAITDAGRAVLGGSLDRVDACGLDRWLGGVHLHAGGPGWRWDEARQRIATR